MEEDKDDREVFEDYRLTSSSLSDKIIKGDLIISSSLSNRNVSLDNVKVEGKLIVEGGKTVTADDCEISELEMNRSDVEFDATGRTKVGKTTFEKYGKLSGSGYSKVIIDDEFNSYIELDANIDYVELDADTNVRLLENCVIETFEATKNADNATVNFNKAEVEDMDIYDAIRITGRGDINNMTVYKSGVKSSIRPDHLDRRNGASKPDYTSTSSGDVGYNPGSRYDDLTVSRNNKIYKGGRYDDVKVTADERVTLKDMTIYGDLTIDEDVENGDVYLEDLDIRGHVYIYGGGESTVSFKDCEIEGNIYAKKDYKDMPVGLYIDGDTVENFDGTLVIEKNGAIVKGAGKLDNVNVLTKSKVEIDTDVKNLYVNAKTDNLTITSGTTVDKLSISSSSAKDSTITNNGTIKELNTSQNITVNGDGTINNTNTTGNGTVTTDGNQKISVTGVTLNKTALTLTEGASEKLTATVQPTNATNTKVTWSSDKTDIATVDANGLVTAKAAGTANITVTTEDGSKKATCTVTVKEATTEIEVTGITISDGTESNKEKTLKVGNTLSLTANIDPSNATNQEIIWSVSDDKTDVDVVTLSYKTDKEITVTANAVGAATVTVKTADGKHTDSYKVTVEENTVAVTGIELDQESLTLEEDATATLIATVKPENATDKSVTWESSDPKSVSVTPIQDKNGKATIMALKATNTENPVTITATAGDQTATCTVTVKAKTVEVTGVTIYNSDGSTDAGDSATINVNDQITFTAKVSPETATEQGVNWSVDKTNNGIVEISQNGNNVTVTGKSAGRATITATAVDGTDVKDSITVTVNPVEVASVSITKDGTVTSYETLNKDATLQLTATVEPSNATNKAVTWSSSDETVATVDKNGFVTAVGGGTATITATAGEQSAECQITVNVPVTGVTISAQGGTTTSPATLTPGGTLQLSAEVKPEDATNKTVTWSITSDPNEAVTLNSEGNTATVTAKSAGKVTITATATDGSGVSGSIEITVEPVETPGGNHPGTGGDNEGGNQTGGTTTQATNNAIVVSR